MGDSILSGQVVSEEGECEVSGKKRTGELVIIGGHENRDGGEKEILSEFVQLAGGERARIVIMPVATQEPEELGKVYVKAFRDLGVEDVKVAIVPEDPALGRSSTLATFTSSTPSLRTPLCRPWQVRPVLGWRPA